MKLADRFKAFEKFAMSADGAFQALLLGSAHAQHFDRVYTFGVVKGGRVGATDKRLLDVFFGQRPFDTVVAVKDASQTGPRPFHLTEHGAWLRYERMDSGLVSCTLSPAGTERFHPREDFIVLHHLLEPTELLGKRKASAHWRALISYMECTSLEGEPSLVDRLRVGWLRLTRVMAVDSRAEQRRIWRATKWTLLFLVNVGLSGSLLHVITRDWSGTAEKASAELADTRGQLAATRGQASEQRARIESLESRIDAMRESVLAQPVQPQPNTAAQPARHDAHAGRARPKQ